MEYRAGGDLNQKIEEIVSAVPWDFPDYAASLLEAYLKELELWNPKRGLVRVASREELLRRHLYDSLAPLPILASQGLLPREKGSAADIGSGGGFPGIPLALALGERGCAFSLVERSGKKAAFLTNAVARINAEFIRWKGKGSGAEPIRAEGGQQPRTDVPVPVFIPPQVLQEDAKRLGRSRQTLWDLVVCRAFMPLGDALEMIIPLVSPGGHGVVYAGTRELVEQELDGKPLWREKVRLIPVKTDPLLLPQERTLVVAPGKSCM